MNRDVLDMLTAIGQKKHNLSKKWYCFHYKISDVNGAYTLIYSLSPKGENWKRNEDVLFATLEL